jgi:hypothetical protein
MKSDTRITDKFLADAEHGAKLVIAGCVYGNRITVTMAEWVVALVAEIMRLRAVDVERNGTTHDREFLGRLVRKVWIEWASEQPIQKPSWLVPWDGLAEPDREVDRRIGEKVAGVATALCMRRAEELEAKNASIRRLASEAPRVGEQR